MVYDTSEIIEVYCDGPLTGATVSLILPGTYRTINLWDISVFGISSEGESVDTTTTEQGTKKNCNLESFASEQIRITVVV